MGTGGYPVTPHPSSRIQPPDSFLSNGLFWDITSEVLREIVLWQVRKNVYYSLLRRGVSDRPPLRFFFKRV